MPGSGAYDSDATAIKKAAPKFGFGTQGRLASSNSMKHVPGPGNYDYRTCFEQKGAGKSMVPRRIQSGKENVPGPGTYGAGYTQTKKRAPSAKIGTGVRGYGKGQDVPGPGNYSPGGSVKNRKAPAYGFGSEVRQKDHNAMKNNPGPGNYEYATSIGTGKKYFMGVKTNSSGIFGDSQNPGPGNYHPDYK